MAKAPELWMEFLGGTNPIPNIHCGLCGNHGIVDTVGKVFTPAGHPCGVRAFCICPNGREMKKAAEYAAKREARKLSKAFTAPPSTLTVGDRDFDPKVEHEEGTDPSHDCGCSMCCGTHLVVNCMGEQRPCDYCECGT